MGGKEQPIDQLGKNTPSCSLGRRGKYECISEEMGGRYRGGKTRDDERKWVTL